MASVLNKRQQARNERALQELIKTVPGNGVCADCSARNPGELLPSLQLLVYHLLMARLRMGQLERKCFWATLSTPQTNPVLVGHFPMHAMRRHPPQAGNAHLQGQIAQYGQMGYGASRCKALWRTLQGPNIDEN